MGIVIKKNGQGFEIREPGARRVYVTEMGARSFRYARSDRLYLYSATNELLSESYPYQDWKIIDGEGVTLAPSTGVGHLMAQLSNLGVILDVPRINAVLPTYSAIKYSKIVCITASIGEYSFGSNGLNTTHAGMNQRSLDLGVNVEWFFYSIGGKRLADAPTMAAEARAAHPENDVLFIMMLGGGDITFERPYSTMTALERTTYDDKVQAAYDAFSDIPDRFFIEPPTFRDYDDNTFGNEAKGSKPYVDAFFINRVPAQFLNTDGNTFIDAYNQTRNIYDTGLSSDNVHPNDVGQEAHRVNLARASVALINKLPVAPIIPREVPVSPTSDLVIISVGDPVGHNSITESTVADQFFDLKDSNGDVIGNIGGAGNLRMKVVFGGVKFANRAGGAFGSATFDNTLSNSEIYGSSMYTDNSVNTYTLAGLPPSNSSEIGGCASRVSTEDRFTELTDGVNSISFQTSGSGAPTVPVTGIFISEANGEITLIQQPLAGQTGNAARYSYVGGISILI